MHIYKKNLIIQNYFKSKLEEAIDLILPLLQIIILNNFLTYFILFLLVKFLV